MKPVMCWCWKEIDEGGDSVFSVVKSARAGHAGRMQQKQSSADISFV